MKHAELYRKDENGNIRVWWMESNDVDAYRTISGVKGGKLVTSEWKSVEGKGIGKAFRNPAEQAESEIRSKYKKQLETQYHESEADVDKPIKFDPMLAQKYEGFVPGTFAQPKLDGCLHGDTLVETDVGMLSMKDIVERNMASAVKSYDIKNNKVSYQAITGRYINGNDVNEQSDIHWYIITLEDGRELTLTGNHRVWLPKLLCWRRVDELSQEDYLLIN